MAVSNYTTISILESKSQWRSLVASSTSYVSFEATHLDSLNGIYLTVTGVTTGIGTPTIAIEQSVNNSVWSQIVAGANFSGSPVTILIKCLPAAGETLYPFLRLKIVTDANSAAVISTITRTIRGVN